ncbi:MAG: hypothetical protein OER90_04540 [Gemmatimonadota bacterium]|nr:hypothetical protein [Gemmatimonadota bacterium]
MPASLLVVLFLLQACQAPPRAVQSAVLEFPEAGVDDPAAYEGYATRFFRDARGNTLQIYLNQRDGRVVHVWADAANESAAFTVRDAEGRAAPVTWGGAGVEAGSDGQSRTMRYQLAADVGALDIGWFLLGTMRQERDFQYLEWHKRPWGDPSFILPELTGLIESLERLPAEEQTEHLALLGALNVEELRSRLEPRVSLTADDAGWSVLVEHTSLDGRNRLTLELHGDADASAATLAADRVAVRAIDGGRIELAVAVTTNSEALTPLGRDRLFNAAFEDYFARQRRTADSLRLMLTVEQAARDPSLLAFRRLERQVLGLELLSSEQKLVASMPNYATYFGRDQMMSALMLEPISSVDLQELVIASVLRKLAPSGAVSHEEALGGQAIRENAAEYSTRVNAWVEASAKDAAQQTEQLARARELLKDLQAVRENYHMIDDDFQLPVLVDRYLSRSDVTAEKKRRFLNEPAGSGLSRLEALARNLAFVAELSRPYVDDPTATKLVSFFHRDASGWLPGSWRDSRAGYGNGRFAMDVNVVWVPRALESVERILENVSALGLSVEGALSGAPMDVSLLEAYRRDPAMLRAAITTWRRARRHFNVRVHPIEVRRTLDGWFESLPPSERDYWRPRFVADTAEGRPLWFLALALDEQGRPIPAVNTDPATDLFIGNYTADIVEGTVDPSLVYQLVRPIMRAYPAGLFVEGLGPVVVNDAFASTAVQQRFREDLYHSPRVVWGREVNLLLLGLARQIDAAYDSSGRLREESDGTRAYVEALRDALDRTLEAVEASGLGHNELWSYRIDGDALRPARYGTSSDIQLWNVTDLAVGFLLDRLPPR